jgi:DNA-binding XRE family transcriptional regulator
MDAIIINMEEKKTEVEKLAQRKRQKVAELIVRGRARMGYTQEELAERLGVRRQTIIKIEGCKYSPNADILYLILECLELTLKIGNEEV